MASVPQSKIRRVLDPDWVRAADVPHRALRYAETLIKRLVMGVEDAAVRETDQVYRATFNTIRTRAEQAAERRAVTTLAASRTAQAWRDEVAEIAREEIAALTTQAANIGLRSSAQAFLLGYYGRAWEFDVATLESVRILYPGVDPYEAVIRELLGVDWRMQYADQLDDLVPMIRRSLMSAINEGDSIPEAMRRVRSVMGIETDRRKGYRSNFNRVQTVTRTVINQASNDGAYSIFQQNADVLSGYQWIVARDERVCPSCLEKANRVYNINDVERPPLHPNCRCTIIPVIRADWMIAADAPPRRDFNGWLDDAGLTGLITPARAGDSRRIG